MGQEIKPNETARVAGTPFEVSHDGPEPQHVRAHEDGSLQLSGAGTWLVTLAADA